MVASPGRSTPPGVAGPEVVGRTLAVWDSKRMDWPKAVVTGYNASTGKHQIRHRGRDGLEAWLDLGKSRFQWVSKPVPGSAPNPTAARAPSDPQALLGVRVRVFWPGMAKWYLGKVVGYDSGSSCHTIKYRDGDEQQLQLCHEAVMYLDAGKRPAVDDSTSPPPAKKARRSSSPRSTSKTRRTSPAQSRRSARQSPSERKPRRNTSARGRPRAASGNSSDLRTREDSVSSSAASSSESSSESDSSSSSTSDRSSSLGVSASTRAGHRRRDSFDSETSSDTQAGRTSATGTRSTTDDPQASGSTPEVESDVAGTRRAGRVPKKVAGSVAASRGSGMAKRGSQSKPRRGSNNMTASSPSAQGPPGVAAVGARVVLLGREDPVPPGVLSPDAAPPPPVYRGQLVQYDSYHKRYKLAYDEGGEEWVSLLRERFWVLGPRTESSEQRWAALAAQGAVNVALNSSVPPASVQVHPWIKACSCCAEPQHDTSTSSPSKQPGVEEPLAVRCLADGRYYFGTVVAVGSGENNETSALVLYADGEDEWVHLGERKGSGACWRPVTPSEKESVSWRHTCPALSAVGWKVALYREPERQFVPGKVVSVKQEGILEIALADSIESIEQVPLKTARPDSVAGAYSSRVKWICPPGLVLRRATPRAGEAEAAGSGGAFSPRTGASPGAGSGPASGVFTPRTASGGVQAKRLPSISRLAVAGSAQPPSDHQGGAATPLLGSPRAPGAFTPMSGEPSGEPRFVRTTSMGSTLRCALGSLCVLAMGAAPLGEDTSRSIAVHVYLSSSSGGRNDKLNTPIGSPQRDVPQSPFQLPDGRVEATVVVSAAS